jgi:hypothetical protein
MKLPRIVRKIAGGIIKSTPILRRQILFSTDYRVLGGVEEAHTAAASSGGWLAARTVARQERAYQGLIGHGEPRLDLRSRRKPSPRLAFRIRGCSMSAVAALLFRGVRHPTPGGVDYTGVDYSTP